MSLPNDLLVAFGGLPRTFRLLKKRMFNAARRRRDNVNDNAVRVALSRLKRNGLVQNDRGAWKLTQKWTARLLRIVPAHQRATAKTSKSGAMIVAFDIPEWNRRKRDWLRIELAILGFTMLQKSVWFGPAPLPESFVETIRTLDLIQFMKFFRARESDIA